MLNWVQATLCWPRNMWLWAELKTGDCAELKTDDSGLNLEHAITLNLELNREQVTICWIMWRRPWLKSVQVICWTTFLCKYCRTSRGRSPYTLEKRNPKGKELKGNNSVLLLIRLLAKNCFPSQATPAVCLCGVCMCRREGGGEREREREGGWREREGGWERERERERERENCGFQG